MLRIENLAFGVNNDGQEKEIIRDISLTIPQGKLIVITGPYFCRSRFKAAASSGIMIGMGRREVRFLSLDPTVLHPGGEPFYIHRLNPASADLFRDY